MPVWDVEWTPAGDVIVDRYNVYTRLKGDPDWTAKGSTEATRYRLEIANTNSIYQVGIAPVVNGLEADDEDWTVDEFRPNSTSDLTTPDGLTNFVCAQNGAYVVAQWSEVTDPTATHVEIREGSSWATAAVVATVRLPSRSTQFGWAASGSRTYRARLKGAGGLKGAESTSTLTIEADDYFPVQATNDEHGGGFAGTKTNVEVNTGNLEPVDLPASYASWTNTYTTYTHPWWWPYIPGGTYVTDADDAGSVVHEKVEVDLSTTLVDSAPTYDKWYGQVPGEIDDTVSPAGIRTPGEPTVYDRIDQDGALVDGLPVTIEIDTTPDDPGGTPTWDGWRIWVPGAIYRYRGVRLRFTFDMLWPFIYPRFTGLTWYRRRLNRKDEKVVTVSMTGGTALTWGTTFTSAPQVVATVIGSTSLFAVVDSITTSGCDVRVFNDAGTEQSTATVHVLAMGV